MQPITDLLPPVIVTRVEGRTLEGRLINAPLDNPPSSGLQAETHVTFVIPVLVDSSLDGNVIGTELLRAVVTGELARSYQNIRNTTRHHSWNFFAPPKWVSFDDTSYG